MEGTKSLTGKYLSMDSSLTKALGIMLKTNISIEASSEDYKLILTLYEESLQEKFDLHGDFPRD